MLVQSVEFMEPHAASNGNGGCTRRQTSIYGQELNCTTLRLAKMNLAIRGIDGHIEQGYIFPNDLLPDLEGDYILAKPPFDTKEWGGERLPDDKGQRFGVSPARNASFAWVRYIIQHLAQSGHAGFVPTNESTSAKQSEEGEIRKEVVHANLVDCMVALPDTLFHSTQITPCVWFLDRNKSGRPTVELGVGARHAAPLRYRRGEVLFIEAREMGRVVAQLREHQVEARRLDEAI